MTGMCRPGHAPCPSCRGEGRHEEDTWARRGAQTGFRPCQACDGTGEVREPASAPCENCGGKGRYTERVDRGHDVTYDCGECAGSGEVAA